MREEEGEEKEERENHIICLDELKWVLIFRVPHSSKFGQIGEISHDVSWY